MAGHIGEQLSEFEQKIAIAWAQVEMDDWKKSHPTATEEEKEDAFVDLIEHGICVSLKLRAD